MPHTIPRFSYIKIAAQALGIASLTCAAPLWASDLICTFDVECYEAEACDEANFELKLVPGATEDERIARSVADRTPGTVTQTESGTMVWQAITPSTVQLLSWRGETAARYTLHLTDGPEVITYHGLCEEE